MTASAMVAADNTESDAAQTTGMHVVLNAGSLPEQSLGILVRTLGTDVFLTPAHRHRVACRGRISR